MADVVAAVNQVTITAKDDTGPVVDAASARLIAFGNIATHLAGSLNGVFAGLGSGFFASMIDATIKLEAEYGRLADMAGMTVEALTSMRLAAADGGLSLEQVATGSERLSKALFEALDGTTKAAQALALLGLDAKALNLLAPADQMKELATRLAQFQDGGAKTAIVMELLGKSGAQFQAFLKALAEDGGTAALITTAQAQAAREAEAAFAQLADNTLKLKIALANELLPTIVEVTSALVAIQDASTLGGKASALLSEDVSLLGKVFKAVFGPEIAAVMAAYGMGADDASQSTRVWGGEMNRARDSLASLGAAAGAATVDMAKLDAVISSIESKDLGIGAGFAASFAVLTQGFNAGVISLERYQQLTKELLDQQPWQAKAAAAAKQLADEQQRALDKQIEYLAALADQVAVYGMSEYALAKYRAELAGVGPAAEADIEQILRNKDALNQQTDALNVTAKAWADYDAAEKRLADAANSYIDSLFAQNDQLKIELDTLGMSTIASQQYILAMQLRKAVAEQNTTAIAALTQSLQTLDQISAKTDLQQAQKEALKQNLDAVKQLDSAAKTAFGDIFENGTKAFKDIGASIKKFLIDVLYDLTVKRWIISIGTSITNLPESAVANAVGGGKNSLSTLFGAANGGGSNLFGGIAGTGLNLGAGTFTGAATDAAWGDALAEGATTLSAGFSEAALAMVPVVGWIAAAGIAIYSLISASKTPAQVKGQLQISPGTTGFEDNAYTPNASTGLNIGFNDQNTQQFSGQVGLALDQLISGAIDAFEQRFSKQQSDAFATVLGNMTFDAFEGTFTTEDFLQKYGGQALQQVVTAAFNILDPALGAVEAGFSGTADEVGTFTNTLLSIYDASKDFSDTFKANIVGALADSTQATADKVFAFVQIIQLFGNGLDPISVTLQGLSTTDIPAFIDALGGASTAMTAMTFLFNNFYTSQQRLTQATAVLNSDFSNIGITAIPQTHQAFLDLLNSFDLTTDAGRQMYNSVLQLAPLFVQVHGTADQAAGAIGDVSDALSQAAQDAQTFFQQNFYSAAEQQAQKLADDTKLVTDAQKALGITIPTTVTGFRQLIEGIDQTTPAGKALYAALIVLAPAVYDLGTAATTTANNVADAVNTLNNIPYPDTASAAQKFLSNFIGKIQSLASGSTGDFADKAGIEMPLVTAQIAKTQAAIAAEYAATGGEFDTTIETLQQELDGLTGFNSDLAKQLAQFTILKAQYGADIAQQLLDLQTWYDGQASALHGNTDALAALQTIFDQKWQDIINGVSTGVTGTVDQLDALRKAILDYANSLTLGNLSPLSPQSQLTDAAAQYQAELAKAQGGDQGALGDITKFSDTYLTLARSMYASSSEYTDIFDQIQRDLRNLAGTGSDAGGIGTPIPQVASGTSKPSTVVTTASGAAVATSKDVQETNELLAKLMDQLDSLSVSERRAIVQSNKDAADEVVTAVTMGARSIAQSASMKKR